MKTVAQHRGLLKPEAYPERTGPIGYQETHVSRLYFTDRHVYKVKKAVDFGFLDFTSLEKRLFFCREELRLNDRFCPDTYLKVVEIRRKGDHFSVEGPGETVDYAVMMKKLPRQFMLDRLLAEDAPSLPAEMDRLARRIAELQRASEICRGEKISNLETVRENWRENFFQTAPFVGSFLSGQALNRLSGHVAGFLEENEALLLQREAEGHIRDLHGDLHTEHICLTEPIRIYDCIEFNRRFRVCDTAADIAFLLMDLDFQNRRDLSQRVLEAYLAEVGGAQEVGALIPFYKIYRAYVRGKVEAFLAKDETAPLELRRLAAALARRYFNLALGYLGPRSLVATCGLMGVGKSTIANSLAESLGAVLLRSDKLRKELAGEAWEGGSAPFGEGIYTEDFSRRTYDLLLERAVEALAEGRSVVADASFHSKAERIRFQQAAQGAGVPFLLVSMECPSEIALSRLDSRQVRGDDISDGRRELYAEQAARFEPVVGTMRSIRVDTAEDVDYNVDLILCELASKAEEIG